MKWALGRFRSFQQFGIVAAWVIGLGFLSRSALADAPAADPQKFQAEKLIDQLDDVDPAVRRVAGVKLNSLPGSALPVVEAALKRDDLSPECRLQLNIALKLIAPRAINDPKREKREIWKSQLFHNAYRDGGHTNPKFDAAANAAIDLYLQLGSDPLHAPKDLYDRTQAAFADLQSAGCDDSLIDVLTNLATGLDQPTRRQPSRIGKDAVTFNYCHTEVPVALKLIIFATYLGHQHGIATQDVEYLEELLTQAAESTDFSMIDADGALVPVGTSAGLTVDFPEWTAFIDHYDKLSSKAPGPLLLRAATIEAQANAFKWSLQRKDRFFDNERAKYFDQIRKARARAQEAYERDTTDSRAPQFMMKLQMILEDEDFRPDDMNQCFALWVKADPDDRMAYELKLLYLTSRLNGEDDDVLAFGQECLHSQNWRARIPLLVTRAHSYAADRSGDRQSYFARKTVWDDIADAYEGGLIVYPDDLQMRCEYAKYACQCSHWDVADKLFQAIGDQPDLTAFGSESSYKYLRSKAHRLAAETQKPADEIKK